MRICVFCGSSTGTDPRFAEAARAVGSALAHRSVGLVYGGANVGLMGQLADAALAGGGEVIGVIPRGLEGREVAHRGVSQLHITDGMHARKQMMYALSDAFLALPGGYGTLDELFETLTWAQLGDHRKPVALLNVARFYDPLLAFLSVQEAAGLLQPEYRGLLRVGESVEATLDLLASSETVLRV
jgi:uncharacterized protein (TIGR00730 family)